MERGVSQEKGEERKGNSLADLRRKVHTRVLRQFSMHPMLESSCQAAQFM